MKTHVLTGTRSEIVQGLSLIAGEVREAIVFVDEPTGMNGTPSSGEDIFVEMQPYMVDGGDVDDSRDSIYSPTDGE
jgi:hypothetical protein